MPTIGALGEFAGSLLTYIAIFFVIRYVIKRRKDTPTDYELGPRWIAQVLAAIALFIMALLVFLVAISSIMSIILSGEIEFSMLIVGIISAYISYRIFKWLIR